VLTPGVRVQVPPRAPNQQNPNQIFPVGDGFGFVVYFELFEQTHFRNGFPILPTSKPRKHWNRKKKTKTGGMSK
jgi:hypothetical protein